MNPRPSCQPPTVGFLAQLYSASAGDAAVDAFFALQLEAARHVLAHLGGGQLEREFACRRLLMEAHRDAWRAILERQRAAAEIVALLTARRDPVGVADTSMQRDTDAHTDAWPGSANPATTSRWDFFAAAASRGGGPGSDAR